MSEPTGRSDLEERVAEALRTATRDPSGAAGLAMAARARARRRRTTRVMVGSAVAVALAVPAAVLTLAQRADTPAPSLPAGPGDHRGDRARDAVPPAGTGVPSGFRVESWHDLQVHVPSTWGWGDPAAWCAGGATSPGQPVVGRPEDGADPITCGPPSVGYGLEFAGTGVAVGGLERGEVVEVAGGTSGSSGTFPASSWVGWVGDGLTTVRVVAPTRFVAEYVLSSVRLIEDTDATGCPATSAGTARVGERAAMTVCRFDAEGRLEASEPLDAAQARAVRAALARAPRAGGGSDAPCRAERRGWEVELVDPAGTVRVRLGTGCRDGVEVPGEPRRALTADVVGWAISPGFGGDLGPGVPVPPRWRER